MKNISSPRELQRALPGFWERRIGQGKDTGEQQQVNQAARFMDGVSHTYIHT